MGKFYVSAVDIDHHGTFPRIQYVVCHFRRHGRLPYTSDTMYEKASAIVQWRKVFSDFVAFCFAIDEMRHRLGEKRQFSIDSCKSMQSIAMEDRLNLTDTCHNFHKQKMMDKRNSIRRRKYLLKFPQLVLMTHLKPETSWDVMSSNNSYTQAVFLFSHYTFSLFLFNLILPVLLLLYILILPFSHPFSRASPSYLIFFPCRWPLKSLLIFCWLFPALSL